MIRFDDGTFLLTTKVKESVRFEERDRFGQGKNRDFGIGFAFGPCPGYGGGKFGCRGQLPPSQRQLVRRHGERCGGHQRSCLLLRHDVRGDRAAVPNCRKGPHGSSREGSQDVLTIQPPQGVIQGKYYYVSRLFNVGKDGGSGYTAVIDLVIDKGRIVHIETDEATPSNYYSDLWRAQRKRTSGYGFFQATKGRTDRTLVTLINGLTFLEWQILKANSLNIDFDTV